MQPHWTRWHRKIALALTVERDPRSDEKAAYHKLHKKAWPKGVKAIDYHLNEFDVAQAEKITPGPNQKLITIEAKQGLGKELAKEYENQADGLEKGLIKRLTEKLEKLEFWMKPLKDCPVCMTFWYSLPVQALAYFTQPFEELGMTITWEQWPIGLLVAYAILLAPSFIESTKE